MKRDRTLINVFPLPRFTSIVVQKYSFVGSFRHPVRGDAKFFWKGIYLLKKGLILCLQLYGSCKNLFPYLSEVILLVHTVVGRHYLQFSLSFNLRIGVKNYSTSVAGLGVVYSLLFK